MNTRKTRQITTRLCEDEYDRITALARELEVSRDEMTRQMLLESVAAHESGERPATALVRRGGEGALALVARIGEDLAAFHRVPGELAALAKVQQELRRTSLHRSAGARAHDAE